MTQRPAAGAIILSYSSNQNAASDDGRSNGGGPFVGVHAGSPAPAPNFAGGGVTGLNFTVTSPTMVYCCPGSLTAQSTPTTPARDPATYISWGWSSSPAFNLTSMNVGYGKGEFFGAVGPENLEIDVSINSGAFTNIFADTNVNEPNEPIEVNTINLSSYTNVTSAVFRAYPFNSTGNNFGFYNFINDGIYSAIRIEGTVGAPPGKFTAASGDWSTGANWLSAGEPIATDDAFVGGGFTTDVAAAGEVAGSVTIGHNGATAPGPGTLNINAGGSLTVTGDVAVGNGTVATPGTLNVNGGTLTVGDELRIGSANSSGVVNLNSGTLNVNGNTTIVDSPVGPDFGTLNINGGAFNEAGDLIVGQTAMGTVNQSAGIANIGMVAGDLEIGVPLGSDGAVNLTGGQMNILNGNVVVGTLGVGALDISGGVFDLSDSDITLGPGGTLTLYNAGRIRDANTISVQGGAGTLVQTSGTLEIGPGPGAGLADITTVLGGFSLISGTVEIDLFSPTEIDLLAVEDTAALNGTVAVSFDFSPVPGEYYDVLTANTIELQPNFGVSGAFYRIFGTAGSGQILQVYAPEPGAMALWSLLALAALGWRMRQRIVR